MRTGGSCSSPPTGPHRLPFLICAHHWNYTDTADPDDAWVRWNRRVAQLIPPGTEIETFSASWLFATTYLEAVALAELPGPLHWRRQAAGGPADQARWPTRSASGWASATTKAPSPTGSGPNRGHPATSRSPSSPFAGPNAKAATAPRRPTLDRKREARHGPTTVPHQPAPLESRPFRKD